MEVERLAVLFLLILPLLTIFGATQSQMVDKEEDQIVSSFETLSETEIGNHLIQSKETGDIYLGATNAIYQLTATDLSQKTRIRTGPEPDSPYCSWNGKDCITPVGASSRRTESRNKAGGDANFPQRQNYSTRVITNNVNQILVAYEEQKILIVCGTLHQGICSMRRLENISRVIPLAEGEEPTPVAANSANASTVAFIAPGPKHEDVLYVGATHTWDAYRDAFPAVASRSLGSGTNRFGLVDPGGIVGQSALHIMTSHRSDFRVKYIGGFYSNGFSYWAAVQPERLEIGSSSVSKILRVCTNDPMYDSYSEIPIECLDGQDNTVYGVLQSFKVGTLGRDVIDSFSADEFKNGDDVDSTEYFVGVFKQEKKPGSTTASRRKSAVCVFPIKQILSTFSYNSLRCRGGVGKKNLPHFGFDTKCYNMSHTIGSQSVEQECLMGRIGGIIKLSEAASFIVDDSVLTGVAVDVTRRHSVLFFGTTDGRLKKVLLKSKQWGVEISEVQLSKKRSPVAVDMFISGEEGINHLFTMAGNEVFKLKLSNCERHSTCATCLQSGDPYCGWCTLENKCTAVRECPQKEVKFGWIPMGGGGDGEGCPRLLAPLEPSNASISVEMESKITIQLSNLPPPGQNGQYQCVFGDSNFIPAEFSAPNTLSCHFPAYDSRPRVQNTGKDHWMVPLKIWSSLSNKVFHEEPFDFYDCGANNLCTSCVDSRWSCHWCLLENRCVHNGNLCQNKVHIITASARPASALLSDRVHYSTSTNGDSQCPHIDQSQMKGKEILIPNGHSVSIRLPVVNLDAILNQPNSPIRLDALECVVQVEGRNLKSRGSVGADGWVKCESRTYHYDAPEPAVDVDLYLSGGGSFVIDKTKIQLYKCDLLSTDCSHCLTMDSRYMCTWCAKGCHFKDLCPLGTAPYEETASSVCPAPIIHSVEPLSGPKEGGTEITILGRDLGTSRREVENRILINNTVPCKVKEYQVSKRIVCITEGVMSEVEGPISIKLGHDKVGVSSAVFHYVSPSIHSFYPTLGPRSGGTQLVISGNNLKTGTETRVWLGGGREHSCSIVNQGSTNKDSIVCETPPAFRDHLTVDEIHVEIDNADLRLKRKFHYTPDPKIISIEPMVSFRSGGRQLKVIGKHLNSTLEPRIFLIDPIKLRERKHIELQQAQQTSPLDEIPTDRLPPLASKLAECVAVNSTLMWCRSPMLLDQNLRSRRSQSLLADDEDSRTSAAMVTSNFDITRYPQWPIGFQMDGVESIRVLDHFQMTVVPDPVYFPFEDGEKLYRGDREPLILEGRFLSMASTSDDVEVFVGVEQCNVTLVAPNQLVCQPPPVQPAPYDLDGTESKNGRPQVTVKVGFLVFRLGEVGYAGQGGLRSSLATRLMDPAVVGGIVTAAAVFLLVIVVFVAVWWRRKSWQAEKEYKRIQLQMDNLESNVRMECKQAFAELQTDMSDLTSDLLALGIPFHTRRSYAAKVLFKDEQHQSLLLDWQNSFANGNGYSNHLHVALAQFESLLWNKRFMIQLVECFERQPTFSAQDRVYVASLLTSVLARNMQYCTDVIMDLLKELIRKNLETRYPQLMLRRTESVVEKMLANWIALCLYDYLQDEPGARLFLLFRALKHQVEKGPVDACTGDARYSLSEDRLLKEQIQAEPVLLHVIPSGVEPGSDDTVPCRVLNVDTISQVKCKILDTLYRNNPHTTRPSIIDFDLEWRCSPKGQVLLVDDERGSPSSKGGWKRLNTVATYNLPSNSLVALIPRSRGSYTYSSSSSHYASINSSTLLIPNGHHSPENGGGGEGTKYWHLVRPQAMYIGDASHVTLGRGSKGTNKGRHLDSNTLPKSIPEIYLTRLLTSKGTVQKFVDDFFTTALQVSSHSFPPVIKYLFDFLEKQAAEHQVEDPGVVYSWKNNSLPLRFWVNIIKNPDFVFDVEKTVTVDSCLSVVAQTFMDACSSNETRLGKDSPSNKLLFAKDIPKYRELVSDFYRDVRQLPPVAEHELNAYMATLSKSYAQEFNVLAAVRELLCYVVKYNEALLGALDADPESQRHRLADRLDQVLGAMSGRPAPAFEEETENIYASVR